MEQLDNQHSNLEASNPHTPEDPVKSMTQDIEQLRQNLVAHLSEDIERLQREKYQLIEDIEQLDTQRQQQIVQQQQLALQIVPTLVNQLQELLIQRLNQSAVSSTASDTNTNLSFGLTQGALQPGKSATKITATSGFPQTSQANVTQENADQLIASLDTTLRATFRALQQDINSYQSSLSQQLGQMYSLEQQGTVILEALVSRLRKEIQVDSSVTENPQINPPAPADPRTHPNKENEALEINPNADISPFVDPTVPVPELPSEPELSTETPPQVLKPRLGFFLVLLSLLALSLENVVVTAIFHKSPILGVRELGGLITPSVSSALLLLWLRMLVIVPLMSLLAPRLYSAVWRDLKKLIQSPDWSLCGSVLGSGFCLFLSQVLIYLALGTISPGVAVTIFFIYPIAIVFWRLGGFRRYPNQTIRWALLSVLVGVLVSIFNSSVPGSLAAAVAGIAFACHMLLMQNCRSKLNPTPMRWIHSVIILFFSTLGLLFLPKSWSTNLEIDTFTGLIIGVALGGAALVSYLLDRTSHKMLPAGTASMLGATVPVLTAFLGFVLLQTVMSPAQILGTLLVSLGVAALSFRGKMRSPQTKMGR